MTVLTLPPVAAGAAAVRTPAEIADQALALVEARYSDQLRALATLASQLQEMRALLSRQLGRA